MWHSSSSTEMRGTGWVDEFGAAMFNSTSSCRRSNIASARRDKISLIPANRLIEIDRRAMCGYEIVECEKREARSILHPTSPFSLPAITLHVRRCQVPTSDICTVFLSTGFHSIVVPLHPCSNQEHSRTNISFGPVSTFPMLKETFSEIIIR